MEEPPKYKLHIPPDIIKQIDDVINSNPALVETMVQGAFLAGMELCMRICRNRAKDCEEQKWTIKQYEALICASLIRNVQVEIGSRRMPRPQFTEDELEEMDRIN